MCRVSSLSVTNASEPAETPRGARWPLCESHKRWELSVRPEDKTGKRVTKFQADTQSGRVGGTRPRPGEGRGQLPPAVAGGPGGLRARARSWLGRGSAIPEDSSAAGKGLRAEQRPRGGLGVQRDARRRRGGRE